MHAMDRKGKCVHRVSIVVQLILATLEADLKPLQRAVKLVSAV